MMNCIIVGTGGFLGAVARYLIGLIPINPQNGFPIKTLLINIIGAFISLYSPGFLS
ncbi:MAG: fluoride efflux transporter FluC [Lachnospiraceae bacterium]|uniref:Fluoride ion transporter CrcB n=1 Tax=[Ruminococcus] torques TaxID=33039 RepID=A0A6N2Z4Q2_9FIRM